MENELEVVNIRLVKEPSLYSEQTLDSPQAVVELMAKELSQYDREVFCTLNMKNSGQVINMNLVSVGTINASLVIPREVFKSSILANASAIIGLHNHPSGNVKPSKEDMIVTRKLQKCGQLLGIELLDHCRWNKWKDAQFPRRKDVECDRKDGLGEIKGKTMSQHAVISLRRVVANRVKIGYTVSIELYINDLLRGWYKICLKNSR